MSEVGFDECVKVGRRRGWDDDYFWTGHPVNEEFSLDDSYYMGEMWWDWIRQERNEELEVLRYFFAGLKYENIQVSKSK